MPEQASQSLEEKLAVLSNRFRADLAGKLNKIEQLLKSVRQDNCGKEQFTELYRLVHSLVGAAGTFGLHDISLKARELEIPLKPLNQNSADLDDTTYNQLLTLFAELRHSEKALESEPSSQQDGNPPLSGDIQLPIAPMCILLADDDPLICNHLQIILEKHGHKIHIARNGHEAVQLFKDINPSLIILDVVMPELNGYEAAKQIKAIKPDSFTPLLFLSSLHEDRDLLKGIANGGDDFLTKPVNENLLLMRIYAMQRIKRVYDELAKHQQRTEEEINTSHHVFEQITQRQCRDVHGINVFSNSAGHFCGDLMLYNISHDNKIYVIHGDFTGHGLSAAIGAIPASDIFYAMSAKGVGLAGIATELNNKLHTLLPIGKFFAASLCCIDLAARSLELWTGGMPPLLGLDRQNQIVLLDSEHLPLSIQSESDFNADCNSISLDDITCLLLCWDGLTEAWNENEEMFGQQRLQDAFLKHVSSENALEHINQDLKAFVQNRAFDDDITMTLLDIDRLEITS